MNPPEIPPTETRHRLIANGAAGDRDALGSAYTAYQPFLLKEIKLARLPGGWARLSQGQREDLAEEVIERVFEWILTHGLPAHADPAKFPATAYLRGLARNLALHELRESFRHTTEYLRRTSQNAKLQDKVFRTDASTAPPDFQDQIMANEIAARILQAIEKMGQGIYHDIALLRWVHRLPDAEVIRRLEVSKSHYYEALKPKAKSILLGADPALFENIADLLS